jgi:hypothetical protein
LFELLEQNRSKSDWTRLEHEHLRIYSSDIRVGIPFVALFALPIVGYSAPLLALLSPRSLPSTLIVPQQKVSFVLSQKKANHQNLFFLLFAFFQRENLSLTMLNHHQRSSIH